MDRGSLSSAKSRKWLKCFAFALDGSRDAPTDHQSGQPLARRILFEQPFDLFAGNVLLSRPFFVSFLAHDFVTFRQESTVNSGRFSYAIFTTVVVS